MKIRLEFRLVAPPGPVNTSNLAKSRNSTADENLAQISHFCPQNRAKSRKCTRDENSARMTHCCTPGTCKHLKIRQNPEIPLPMKIWHKFHIFAPKIGQNQENALAMKIRLEFRILAPPGRCKHLKSGKIQKFHCRWKFGSNFTCLPPKFGKIRKCTRDENSARISHSCTSRSCKHLKSGKIQKFHCRWKFGSNFTFLPPKSGKIQKMHSRWKFGSNYAFLHLPDL